MMIVLLRPLGQTHGIDVQHGLGVQQLLGGTQGFRRNRGVAAQLQQNPHPETAAERDSEPGTGP